MKKTPNEVKAREYLNFEKEYYKGIHTTPISLIQKGMCNCDQCGQLSCVDNKRCKNCNSEIVIFIKR